MFLYNFFVKTTIAAWCLIVGSHNHVVINGSVNATNNSSITINNINNNGGSVKIIGTAANYTEINGPVVVNNNFNVWLNNHSIFNWFKNSDQTKYAIATIPDPEITIDITCNNGTCDIVRKEDNSASIEFSGDLSPQFRDNILTINSNNTKGKIYLPQAIKKIKKLSLNNNNGKIILKALHILNVQTRHNSDSTKFINCDIENGSITSNNSTSLCFEQVSSKAVALKLTNSKINLTNTNGSFIINKNIYSKVIENNNKAQLTYLKND